VWSFSLRLFVCFVTTVRAFRYSSSCVWAPILPTGLAFHLGAPLSKSPCLALGRPTLASLLMHFVTSLRAFGCPCCEVTLRCVGHPSCELALRCVRAPNLGEAVLKNLPPSQNWFLSVIRLVFFPSAPLCGHFRYGSSCISLRSFVHFVTALRAFHCGSSCILLQLFMRLGTHLANWPCIAFGCPSCQLALPCPWSGSSCISLQIFMRLGTHLENSPCLAFGRPTLVRSY
jgi:hypothetical protein